MIPLAAVALLADLAGPARPIPRVRPAECNVLPGERGANVWERAKVPELRHYCDLVASAAAKLAPGSRMLGESVQLAEQAEALVPGRAAPVALKGRALCLLGRYAEARGSLETARGRDPRVLEDPAVLFAWARSLAFLRDVEGSRAAYRALLPRADGLPLGDRGAAYLGAAMALSSLGPSGLEETIGVLRQARVDSQDVYRSAATFALALALDRKGEAAEAIAVVAEEGPNGAATILASPRVIDALGPGSFEALAMGALALEVAGQREAARAAWARYDAQPAASVWHPRTATHLAEHAASPRRAP